MAVIEDERLRAFTEEQLKNAEDLTKRLHLCMDALSKNVVLLTIEQQLRIEAVFIAACAANGGAPTGARLGSLIAPVVARSPEEQFKCQAIVASWFPEARLASETETLVDLVAPVDSSAAKQPTPPELPLAGANNSGRGATFSA